MPFRTKLSARLPYPWLVVGLASVGQMAEAMTALGIAPLYPFIQDDLRLTRAEVGLISSALVGGGLITGLPLGLLTDRVPVRRIVSVALLLVVVSMLLFSQVNSLGGALIVAALASMAGAGVFPATTKAIMDWLSPRTRGVAMGIKQTGVPIGGALAAAIMPALAMTYGWRVAVIVLSLILGAIALSFFALYRDPRQGSVPRRGGRASFFTSVPLVARNRDLLLCTLLATILVGLQFTVVTYFVLFLTESLLMSAVAAGAFLSLAMLSSFVARILWGVVSDFILGGRRVVVLATISILSAILLALIPLLPQDASGILVGALAVAIGMTTVAWTGVYVILVAELAGPGLTGTAIGFVSIIQRLGGLAIPPVFGLVADRTGSYDVSWWMAAGLAALGASLLAFLRPATWRR